jgi:hypothetical protein
MYDVAARIISTAPEPIIRSADSRTGDEAEIPEDSAERRRRFATLERPRPKNRTEEMG